MDIGVDRGAHPPVALVFTKAMDACMRGIAELSSQVWQDTWHPGYARKGERQDGYRTFEGRVPVVACRLDRTPGRGAAQADLVALRRRPASCPDRLAADQPVQPFGDLPRTLRGLANLARLAGEFPTALAAVPTLGWKGRAHRVLGDIHCSQADTVRAIATFEAGRSEAEQHGASGERAMMQVRLALAIAFADPDRAADEFALAHQLLDGLDQRSNTLLAQVVTLIKDAGYPSVPDRAEHLRSDVETAGLPFLHRFVELALAFHHAVRSEAQGTAATIGQLRALTASGDFAYFTDIAHFMAALPLPGESTTRWTTSDDHVRSAWRSLVQARQEHLRTEN
ncbi:hypothetical protein ACIOD1_34350 [Streptomyces sp. NPDC088097]|uniref:hypothetical protein n=1 Tax=Streptomyces sp. NPDC088097 TaxID=3365823 RepID=UPI0037F1A050